VSVKHAVIYISIYECACTTGMVVVYSVSQYAVILSKWPYGVCRLIAL